MEPDSAPTPTAIWRWENFDAWQGLLETTIEMSLYLRTQQLHCLCTYYFTVHKMSHKRHFSFYFSVVGYFDSTLILPILLIKFTLNQRMKLATS